MVGLLTPNVVVTDLSSFLSSMVLWGRRRRKMGDHIQNEGRRWMLKVLVQILMKRDAAFKIKDHLRV